MSGHQHCAGLCQLPQKTDADAGCFLWVVLEPVVPVWVLEPNREHGVASKHQPIAARHQANHAVSGSVAASAMNNYSRRHLLLLIEPL